MVASVLYFGQNPLRMVVEGRKMFGYPFSDVIQEALR